MPTMTIVTPALPLLDGVRLAVAGFLARYQPTRQSYATDRRRSFFWCAQMETGIFSLQQGRLEL